ncbi:MAG TPA: condensation domain-containing protein, partial [Thermoanaerobaculia bacterium]
MTEALSTSDKRRLLRAQLLRKEGFAAEAPQRIPRRAGTGPARLSFGQQRLWFLHQLDPASPAYNLMEAVHLRGDLDALALQRALAEVVRRHDALRTTFPATDGQPVQAVPPAGEARALSRADLAVLPEAARAAETARLASALRLQPFDLARGPLFAPLLLRLDAAEHVLMLRMHHAVSDGWSMGLLVRELTTLYAAFVAGLPSPLPELPIQYPDFAEWQWGHLQGEVLESHLRFWRERLAGAPTALELPTDRPRPPVQTFHGRREPVAVPAVTAAALREVARACAATPFMALVAALGTLLLRSTGQEDLLIGTPVAGRNRPETESLIGFFVNTLVLRLDLAGDPIFQDLLPRVRAMVMDAGAHQDLPFEKLVDALDLPRDLSRSPLFQVVLTFQNLPPAGGERPHGLALSPYGFEARTAQFDLHLILTEGPHGLEGNLEYRTDLFDPPTAKRFARRFEALVAAAVAQPLLPLSTLPLLSAAEAQQVEREWNDTRAGYPELSGEPSLHGLVAAQERRTPGAVAVTFEGRDLTWAELGSRARALAARLRALGCGPESRVGISMERSAELMVALLGILHAGAAYVPLDPDYPRDRLAFLLEDSRPAALLTQERLLPSLPPFNGPVLCPDTCEETADPDPAVPAGGSGLAYVLYTSGSTGRPKGAMVHHRAIVNRLLWMQDAYCLTPADTVLQKTPFSFDVSVWEFFWPLLAGARLVLAQPGGHRDPSYLADLVESERVTVVHFVPSMLQAFLEEPSVATGGRCPSLRLVVASG